MTSIRNVYQEIVMNHNRNPKNFGQLEHPTHQAEGNNPLCGDEIQLYLQIQDHQLHEIAFEGEACAICKASTSMMTESIQGKSIEEIIKLNHAFDQFMQPSGEESPFLSSDLLALGGVRKFPSRIQCAQLPWQTLQNALTPEN